MGCSWRMAVTTVSSLRKRTTSRAPVVGAGEDDAVTDGSAAVDWATATEGSDSPTAIRTASKTVGKNNRDVLQAARREHQRGLIIHRDRRSVRCKVGTGHEALQTSVPLGCIIGILTTRHRHPPVCNSDILSPSEGG